MEAENKEVFLGDPVALANDPCVLPTQRDLVIAYRIYPRISRVPPIHADDKLKLSELCARSLRDGLAGLSYRLIVLLDQCPPVYQDLFRDLFPERNLELAPLAGEGNLATFGHQIDRLASQSDSEAVYFAEDDYFYFPGALGEMRRFLASDPGIHFVTGLDHGDYHRSPLHEYPRPARDFEGRRWRQSGSTCLTFMTRRNTLMQTREHLRTYCRGNTDAAMWFGLTGRSRSLSPWKTAIWKCPSLALGTLAYSWRFGSLRNPGGSNFTLWAPEPTLCAHMENQTLPPGMDWDQILQEASQNGRPH